MRSAEVTRTVGRALESAQTRPDGILAAGLGVAAAVASDGNITPAHDQLQLTDTARTALTELTNAAVLIDNDANLAALGERWSGTAQGCRLSNYLAPSVHAIWHHPGGSRPTSTP
jgi:predicted NBD/HSP70 family sugar kinase